MKVKIVSRYDSKKILLCGEYESIKDCLEKNRGADLRGANLKGAINYANSHDFFQEIVRIQDSKLFTGKEWVCVGQICIHTLCWDSIKKRFDKTAMSVFKKLSKVGFNEWEIRYKEE